MKSQPWTEDARFESRHRKRRSPQVVSEPADTRGDRDDPFEHLSPAASHALEPGWLVDATFPPPSNPADEVHDARSWKEKAAELGGRLRDVERRATARLWAKH